MASLPSEFTVEQLQDPLFFFSAEDRQLLRRCATLRTVDADVYDEVVRVDLTGVTRTFDDLAAQSYAEAVPGPVARFSLRDPLRSRAFQSWWTDEPQPKAGGLTEPPATLRRFSARLVDYYSARQQPLERLYHLVAADRTAAGQEFRKLFEEADAALDLAYCTALIHLLEERSEILGELALLLNEARRRLRARTLWAREQYETVYYLERDSTRALLDQLLGDGERRILQIFAQGGMGKTMFLRATIARRCVPLDIPCARIDFDLEPKDVAHSAWWLCIRMAQQLSQQLPHNPFEEFLTQYERHLAPQRSRGDGSQPAPRPALEPETPRRIVNSFLEKVDEIDRPFLVIFDTLENLRGNEEDQHALYDFLKRLLGGDESAEDNPEGNPDARVILAGRFDLRQPIEGSPTAGETEFNRRFGQRSIPVHFRGFSDDEAQDYLIKHRKVADDARISVLLDKARTPQDGINPFTLAILADVLRANPTISAAALAAYPNANLAYLIERVIERIEDRRVRWVVRYGVAPRRLTRAYVEQVLLPLFQEVEARPGQLDDAQKDRGVPQNAFGKPGAPGDAGQLWQTLFRYVSDYSWVMTASDTPDALVFHASVLEPMRDLLWEQLEEGRPVLRLLHQRSLAFYTSLAQTDPVQAGRWLREALYHKVQSGETDVDDFWFAQVAAYPQQAHELSSELLALAAAAAKSQSVRARTALIGEQVQAAAAYRLADRLARTSPLADRKEQERLADWLATIERYNPTDQPVTPLAGIAWLRARLQQAQGNPTGALASVEAALPLSDQAQTAIDLHLLQGDLLGNGRSQDALAAYRIAFQWAESQAEDRLPDTALPLARLLRSLHQEDKALAVHERLFAHARTNGDDDLAVESLVAQTHLLLALGLDGQAAARAGGAGGLAGGDLVSWIGALPRHQRVRLECEAALAARRPDDAWQALESLTRTGSSASQLLPPAWPAIDADLRARTAALQADIRTAYSRYDQVASLSPPDRAANCLLTCAELALDEAGDLNLTDEYLRRAASYGVEAETELRRRLLASRLLARRGQKEEAKSALQSLWGELSSGQNPFSRVAVAVELLGVGGDAETLIRQIAADLVAIQPASRRLLLLAGMERCPVLTIPLIPADELLRLFPPIDTDGYDPALAGLRLAQVYRVCGRREEALGLLTPAWTEAGQRLAILRKIFLAYDRLAWSHHLLEWANDLLLAVKPPPVPDLLGLAALEQAERLYRHQLPAQEMLDFASKTLNHPSSLWTARITALQARLALAAGDHTAAASLAETAHNGYLSLGDREAAAALSEEVGRAVEVSRQLEAAAPGPEAISKSLTPVAAPFLNLTVALGGPEVSVQAESSDNRRYEAQVGIGESVQDAFALTADALYAENFPIAFSRDWLGVSHQMGALLLPEQWALVPQLDAWPEGTLRFSTHIRQSQWLPWELARPAVDALPLPLRWEKLCFYRHIPYAQPPHWEQGRGGVLIVRLSEVQERVVMRGSRQLLGTDIANLYRQAAIAVNELQEPTSRELSAALESLRPSVLHLIANIREQNGSLSLDVGADDFAYRSTSRGLSKGANQSYDSSAGLELSPRELGNTLRRAGAEPFVILDTPAPGSVTEWVRQLCLRNAFAGEWAQAEPPPGILATGMGFREEQSRIYEVLLETLPQGISFQNLTRRIWDQAAGDGRLEEVRRYDPNNRLRSAGVGRMRNTNDLPGYFSFASAALFTGDPTLRIPPLAGKGG